MEEHLALRYLLEPIQTGAPLCAKVHVRNGLGPVEDRTSEWEAEGEQ